MADTVRFRCPVCGAIVSNQNGLTVEHVHKGSRATKVCYGSRMPVLTTTRGEVYPGDLIYTSRRFVGPALIA